MTTLNANSRGKPSVCLIVLMRNEERFVERCLDSLLPQLGSVADSEILCVDGMSTDRTREIVQGYAGRCPAVRLVDNPENIVSSGFNRGVREARGDLIFCLSCHALYAEDYIARCVEVSERTGADAVGGYLQTLPGRDNPVGRAISAATSSRFGVGGSSFRTGGEEQEVDTVPFGCYRREVFEIHGLFDERLVRNQDIEFNSRIRKGGGKLVISPKIELTYFNRATFAGIRQQAFNNGLWNPYTIYLVGGGLRPRHFVPMAFVLSLLVLGIGGFFWWPIWLALAGEVAVYLLAAGAAALSVSRKKHVSCFLVWLTFIQLHVWYGLGSLWGVLTVLPKFGFRKQRKPGKALADRKD
jgi:GT2 family glycosyltransferase